MTLSFSSWCVASRERLTTEADKFVEMMYLIPQQLSRNLKLHLYRELQSQSSWNWN